MICGPLDKLREIYLTEGTRDDITWKFQHFGNLHAVSVLYNAQFDDRMNSLRSCLFLRYFHPRKMWGYVGI
jgi:hypothetical protein